MPENNCAKITFVYWQLFGSKIGFGRILHLPYRAIFGGVHAFGYNSVESELIWMKSGAL